MGEFSVWHLLIVAAVFVLLFGAKRLPDAARSLGKSLRIFKTEVKGLHDDDPPEAARNPATPAQLPAGQTPPPNAAATTAGDRSDLT